MPIDPQIPLAAQPPRALDPMAAIQTVFAIKAAQQEQGIRDLQMQEMQQKRNDLQSLDQAFQQPGGRDAVLGALPGHLRPVVSKQFIDMDEAHAKYTEAQGKADEAKRNIYGTAAAVVKAHDYDPVAAQGMLSDLKLKFQNDPAELQSLQQFEQQLHANPTKEFVQQQIDPILSASPKQAELENARVTAQSRAASAAKPTSATLAVSAVGGDPQAQAALEALHKSQGAHLQSENVLLNGKPTMVTFDPTTGKRFDAAGNDVSAQVKPMPPASVIYPRPPTDKLIKVEHKDPATGRTVIEWLPESQVKGQVFEKGTSATTETRLASAQAVNQTGNDIIAKLQDPAYAKNFGVAMGRYNSLRDFIGNPPPEFGEIAGMIESYSLANMGVHGMRSAQGAQQINALLNEKQTPASLIAKIKGLQSFSEHFMRNEGRGSAVAPAGPPAAPTTAPPKVGERRMINGQLGEWDGKGWKPVR